MTDMSVMSITSMFLIGLLGAGHCVGMCGGIVAALGFATDSNQPRWPIILTYNLGRISSYGLMGGIVGLLGQFGDQLLSLGPWLRAVSGLLLILMGFYLADWWKALALLERIGQLLWKKLQPLGKGLFQVRSVGRGFLYGMLWGWLPCGLVYSALAFAGASASPVMGAFSMMAFGLGTLPAMLAGGLFSAQLKSLLQGKWLRVAMALVLIVFGSWTLWSAMSHNHSTEESGDAHSSYKHMHH